MLRTLIRVSLVVLLGFLLTVMLAQALGRTFTFLVVVFQERNEQSYFSYLDLTTGRVYNDTLIVPASFSTDSSPNWSSDGRYIEGRGSGTAVLFDTYTRTVQTVETRMDCGGWWPDNVHLSCWQFPGNNSLLNVYTMAVEPLFPGYSFNQFALSPDGQQIAFAVPVEQTSEIFIGAVDDSTSRFLTTQGPNIRVLNWSPDGRYLMTYNTDYQIWSVYLVSTRTGRAYAFGTDFEQPFSDLRDIVWSPDGSKVAFRSITRDTLWTYHGPLYVLELDTMRAYQLIDDGELPRWSPDSQRLLIHSSERVDLSSGGYTFIPRVFVVNWDGSNLRQLGERLGAAWQPDSRNVVLFDGDGVIYTMNVDDPESVRFIHDLNQQGSSFYVTSFAFWR